MAKQLLNAATATGAGNWAKGYKTSKHVVEVTTSAVMTALTVDLEGTIDTRAQASGYTAASVSLTDPTLAAPGHVFTAAELTAKRSVFFIINELTEFVRANILTYTPASGSPTVTVKYLGESSWD